MIVGDLTRPITASCFDPPPSRAPNLATPPTRILVTGGRMLNDPALVFTALDLVSRTYAHGPLVVVHGGARGADRAAGAWAKRTGHAEEVHLPDYNKHPPHVAPKVRNSAMVAKGARYCVAFPGGSGTEDTVTKARAAGIPVLHARRDLEWSDDPLGDVVVETEPGARLGPAWARA